MPRKYWHGRLERSGAIAKPRKVGGQVVPPARGRRLPGLRLLVVEVQPFMAGEELDAVQLAERVPAMVSMKRIAMPTDSTIAR